MSVHTQVNAQVTNGVGDEDNIALMMAAMTLGSSSTAFHKDSGSMFRDEEVGARRDTATVITLDNSLNHLLLINGGKVAIIVVTRTHEHSELCTMSLNTYIA